MNSKPLATLLITLLGGWACSSDEGAATDNTDDTSTGGMGTAPTTDNGSGGSNAAGASGMGAGAASYKACNLAEKVGTFRVDLATEFTTVQGSVSNGVVPSNIPELRQEEGECSLNVSRNLICDPSCGAGETCGEDATCIVYPADIDVGTVSVKGLTADVEMTPSSASNFYSFKGTLPHPGFSAGDSVQLSATGGEASEFTLLGEGFAPLEVTHKEVVVQEGQAVALSWRDDSGTDATRVRVRLDIAQHGGTPASIDCDVADNGEFTIPESLVTELVKLGFSGFPSVSLRRLTADAADLSVGCVEFVLTSEQVSEVTIPGLVSCSGDEDCPDGQTCQINLTCQ